MPYDATDTELLALGLPFGRVKNVLLLKAKKPHEPTQGFIEMEDKQTAATFLSYYTQAAPAIRGQVVYVQYSNHPELKTEPSQHSVGVSILEYYLLKMFFCNFSPSLRDREVSL